MFAKLLGWYCWHNERRKEKGQGLVEYALILVLVSIVVIAVLSFLGTTINTVFEDVTAALEANPITIEGARHRPNSQNGDVIEIRALYNGIWDPNVTLNITGPGNYNSTMNPWDNNTIYGRQIPASGLNCPCTFTISNNGKSRSVTVNTNYN